MAINSLALVAALVPAVSAALPCGAQSQDQDGEFFWSAVEGRPLVFSDEADGLWVRGLDYKAKAAPGGFTFIPFLGSSAPRSYPLHFAFEGASIGADQLATSRAARVERDGQAFALDRGVVVERYLVGDRSVEQLFEIAGIAGRSHDLLLSLAIDSDLEPTQLEDGSLVFAGPQGGVTYGTAIAFDEAGRRADVPVSMLDGSLQLTVPAAFVAAARGTITVDPVIATYLIDPLIGMGFDRKHSDVAYDVASDRWAFVYDEQFSSVDSDVYWTVTDTDGGFLGTGAMNMNVVDYKNPKIASAIDGSNVGIIAGRTGPTLTAIRFMTVDPDTLTEGPVRNVYSIPDPTSTDYDIGGSSDLASPARFHVAWISNTGPAESSVGLAQVDEQGFVLGTGFFDSSNQEQKSHLAVSKSTGVGLPAGAERFTVTYAAWDVVANETELRAMQFDEGGALQAGPGALLTTAGSPAYTHVDVSEAIVDASFEPAYLVVTRTAAATDDLVALFCRGATRKNTLPISSMEHAPPGLTKRLPQLGATRTHFVLTYFELNGLEYQVVMDTISPFANGGLAIGERRVKLGQAGQTVQQEGGPRVATIASGGVLQSGRVVVCWSDRSVDPVNGTIRATTYDIDLREPLAIQFCEGQDNSTGERSFLTLVGTPDALTPKHAIASGLPPSQFGYLNSATAVGNVPGAGGSAGTLCIGGVIGRYNDQILLSDNSGVIDSVVDPLLIPSGPQYVSAMAGQLWVFQLWHRDVLFGQQTSNFTNGVIWLVD